ncbi:MAG: HEAT repeat domain-containing protein [Bacteroidales bacterium]|nr:HEAT repeat domain-containing protein [Bacteroidales bacterium]
MGWSVQGQHKAKKEEKSVSPEIVYNRLRAHSFNPLKQDNSMTIDKILDKAGIAELDDQDWKVRLLAVRDLIKAGKKSTEEIIIGLSDSSMHIRQVCAMALGILKAKEAIGKLEQLLKTDENTMVRSQAAIALGQMEAEQSVALLKEVLESDPSRDVMHQCELAIDQIKKHKGTSDKMLEAFLSIDESTFETVIFNSLAPDFKLEDTDGNEWELVKFRNKQWVVLIWVFADWCPVCHSEFHDLMNMQKQFKDAGIQVFTLEIHDMYRGRVMVGKELEPTYWFAKESFKEAYTNKIWWPHLLDRGGIQAAKFGADPLAFSVHAEYINRPTTAIIDKNGILRFLYQGTFWGDRPSIEQTLEMIENEEFNFEHQDRLKIKQQN